MSFDALVTTDCVPKKEEIKIKIKDTTLIFYANEISYLQRINLAAVQENGGDQYLQLIVFSITDQAGKHMSPDQARALPPEFQQIFFVAAAKVNSQPDEPKKKSKKRR